MGTQKGCEISIPRDIQKLDRHCPEKSNIIWICFQVASSGYLQKSFSTWIIMHTHKYA